MVTRTARSPVVTACGLTFAFPGQPALFQDFSFIVSAGLGFIHGDESCGKTSLLKVLAGEFPTNGQLELLGISMAGALESYRRQVAWLDPSSPVLDGLTARQLWAQWALTSLQWDASALERHIEGFALESHLDKTLAMLSTGGRRKVLMACALASGRALTLLDQPFASLDQPSRHYLIEVAQRDFCTGARALVMADYEVPLALSTYCGTLIAL
ncbi:MAG: ATP-binding cassette domain-containing protein [Pseudomonadota bacterium]